MSNTENRVILGIDNGVSGTLGVILPDNSYLFLRTPVKKGQSYTKKVQNVSRIDVKKLNAFLSELLESNAKSEIITILERPMINPSRFVASMSAIRALEATLICLESFGIDYQFVDSKNWQSKIIPNVKGTDLLKEASMKKGIELFPIFQEEILHHKDCDGLLIAYWYKEFKIGENKIGSNSRRNTSKTKEKEKKTLLALPKKSR
jgi:hypothetical protein